jgi:GMP synthase (glutamine-hydrolysing)
MILIIDFGSQYNQLIARRVRECNVFCQIEPPGIEMDKIRALNPDGIILSGGPASVYENASPKTDPEIFNLGIPVLGICYGLQFMIHALGGKVNKAQKREYGFASLDIHDHSGLYHNIDKITQCWMSHGDSIESIPEGFEIDASTENTKVASCVNHEKNCMDFSFIPRCTIRPKEKRFFATFCLIYVIASAHGP